MQVGRDGACRRGWQDTDNLHLLPTPQVSTSLISVAFLAILYLSLRSLIQAWRFPRRNLTRSAVTNLVLSEWTRIFKHPMTTMAAADRVVHHLVILDLMQVKSYRAREATHGQRRLGGSGTSLTTSGPAPRTDEDVRVEHAAG